MKKAIESEEIHFFNGLPREPAVVSHAVGGDENAGAVVAELAVNKYFFLFISEEGEKLRDLRVRGWRPAADGDINKVQSERFGLFTLLFDEGGVFAAKIDDGGDTEFFEFFDAFGMRLRAAKERIVNFSGVGKAGEFEFLAVGRTKNWWRIGRGRRLRAEGPIRRRKKNEEQSCK